MSEEKQPARISFARDKVQKYEKGSTGITGTSKEVVEPMEKIEISQNSSSGQITYSASDLLFKNIDNLKSMFLNDENTFEEIVSEPKTEEEAKWENTDIDNLSEEEVIKNLNQHLGYRPADVDLSLRMNKDGHILPQQVIRPETLNGKVISQNIFTPAPSASETKIIETNTTSIKDLFCRNCGSQYLETDNFCGGCGNKRN